MILEPPRRVSGAFLLGAGTLAAILILPWPPAHGAVPACDGVSPATNTELQSVAVVTGLPGRPLSLKAPPGDTDRLFIVDQNGRILIYKRGDPPGTHSVFLDIRGAVSTLGNEMGLLGLAFDPDYAATGQFYVNYTEESGGIHSVVARYSVAPGDADTADPASELRLLRIAQPATNHNGGDLAFGPDGMLYVSSGDGGSGGDPWGTCGNGQSTATLLGKILRIDPSGQAAGTPDCGGTLNYSVPAGNPLADGPGGDCDEIWAWGLRNPWRISFDALTGDLYLGDVGQECWEEINYEAAGGPGGVNYGWRQMEGTHCFDPADSFNCNPFGVSCSGSPRCGSPSLELPVAEHGHGGGACSVVGGFAYRGCRMPAFHGVYFYGDFCAGFVRSFEISGGSAVNPRDWTADLDPGGTLPFGLTGFGEDGRGEIYLVDRGGTIRKIMPPFPDLEVSGGGSGRPLLAGPGGTLEWEDLQEATMHPVDFYRVYRGEPGGTLNCVHATRSASWAAGDPAVPAPGEVLGWVVTAVSPGGEETSSGSPPRTLASPCPAPL